MAPAEYEEVKEEFDSMIKVIFEGAEGDLRLEGGGILNSGVDNGDKIP